jgi:hypothetical protein
VDEVTTDRERLARRPLLFGAATMLVLAAVFIGGILALAWVSGLRHPDGASRNTQTALLLYARIVLIKALVPHAFATCATYAIVERFTAVGGLGRWFQRAAFGAIGLVAAALITWLWLPSTWFDLARITTHGPANFASTCMEITVATTAAALVARWLLDRRVRRGTPAPPG